MKKERLTIIVPTHDSYIDLFAVFLRLFKKNWANCPYRLVLSCNEYPATEYKNINVVNNSEDTLITMRVSNAAHKFPADYYLVLLEDMFIDKPVDDERFAEILDFSDKNGLHYCGLNLKLAKKNSYMFTSKAEPYGISFGAFICDNYFIENYLNKNITGWDFENEQLKLTLQYKKKEKFTDCAHCTGNPLNIIHGIDKGRWIRTAKKAIGKDNPEIDLGDRPLLGRKETIKRKLYSVSKIFKPKSRARIKKFLRHFGFKFTTDY